jgi:hypothetical protein
MRFTVSSLTFLLLVTSTSLPAYGHRVPLHRRGNCLSSNCLAIGHAGVNDQEAIGQVAIFQQGNGHVPHAPVQVAHAQVANAPAANAPLAPAQVAHAEVADAPDAIAQQDRSRNPPRPSTLPVLSCEALSESHYCVRHCHCTDRRLVSCPPSTLPPSDQPDGEAGPSTQTNEVKQKNEEYCAFKCICIENGIEYCFGKSRREWNAYLGPDDSLVEEFRKVNPGGEHSFMHPLKYLEWMDEREV